MAQVPFCKQETVVMPRIFVSATVPKQNKEIGIPKYFFRLATSDLIPEDGEVLPDMEAVVAEAKAMARDLARNQPPSEIEGKSIIVSDKSAAVVFRTPLPKPP